MWWWFIFGTAVGTVSFFSLSKVEKAKAIYRIASWNMIREFLIFRSRLAFQNLSDCGSYSVGRSTCEVVFYDGSQRYKIVFPRRRGPSGVARIMHGDDDVTNAVFESMGPCHNFYGIPTTPSILNYSNLSFETIDGDTMFFDEKDVISFD